MPNAVEMFRAQRDAADQVHARLSDVADMLNAFHTQVAALAENRQLRDVVQEQQTLVMLWCQQRPPALATHGRFRPREASCSSEPVA